jgi:hypothetical protein
MKSWHFLMFIVFLLSSCEGRQESRPAELSPEVSRQTTEAIQDLSGRLGIPSGEIQAVSEKRVTWRDGSLGCPKEGMMYTQALIEGTRIVLRVEGRDYQYHSGQGRAPFYCENPVGPASKSSAD